MSTGQKIRGHRNEILRVAARHGAGNVRLFGSGARGEDTPESDVDFLLDVTGDTTPWFPGSLVAALQQILGPRPQAVAPGLRLDPEPVRREPRTVAPGTAPHTARISGQRAPRICACPRPIITQPIRGPLPSVTEHVICAIGIRRFAFDFMGAAIR